MNKLFSKIAALSVGLALTVGFGVTAGQKEAVKVDAAAGDTYNLVTSVDSLAVGDEVLFGYTNNTVSKASGALNANTSSYLKAEDATITDGVLTYTGTNVKPLTLGKSGDNWTFTYGTVTVSTTAAKKMCVNGTSGSVSTWTISITSAGVASVASTTTTFGTIQYNADNPRFLNYATSQSAIGIYKKANLPSFIVTNSSSEEGPFTVPYGPSGMLFYAKDSSSNPLNVDWSVSDATVLDLDESFGDNHCWIKGLKPGTAKLQASLSGYKNFEVNVTVDAGNVESIAVTGTMTKTSYNATESWDPAGLVVNATYDSGYSGPVSEGVTWSYDPASPAIGVTSVVATAHLGGKTADSEAQTVTVTKAPGTGTESDPYNVMEARAAIDVTPSGISNKYVTGIICQVDSYNSTYKSLTYWISDDGSNSDASKMLQVYSGKGLNGADFSSTSDLTVGYSVKVNGKLKKYNSTYEFDVNSQIKSYEAPVVTEVVSVKSSPTEVTKGGSVLLTEVELNVKLSSGASAVVRPTSIVLDTSVAAPDVVGKAYYKEVGYAEFHIAVIEKTLKTQYVLTSNTSTYNTINTQALFQQYITDSEDFTIDVSQSGGNLRVGSNPKTTYIMFGYSSSKFSLYVPSGYVITKVVVKGNVDSATSLKVGGISASASRLIEDGIDQDFVYYPFSVCAAFEVTSRVWVKSITIDVTPYDSSEDLGDLATLYGESFLAETGSVCVASGDTPKAALKESWGVLEAALNNLDGEFEAEANLIRAAEPAPGNAIERYKYIVEKYGTEDFPDFAGKGYEKQTYPYIFNNASYNPGAVVLIIIGSIAVLSVGLIIVLRKKKEQ